MLAKEKKQQQLCARARGMLRSLLESCHPPSRKHGLATKNGCLPFWNAEQNELTVARTYLLRHQHAPLIVTAPYFCESSTRLWRRSVLPLLPRLVSQKPFTQKASKSGVRGCLRTRIRLNLLSAETALGQLLHCIKTHRSLIDPHPCHNSSSSSAPHPPAYRAHPAFDPSIPPRYLL